MPGTAKVEPEPTAGFDRVIQYAVMHAAASSAKEVSSGDLLVFMLQEEESHAAYFLRASGIERLTLLRVISHGAAQPVPAETPGGEAPPPAADPLETYATNLNLKAAEGRIDPLIGRVAELERIVQVLCRRRKNNPLLVGEPGVGKTALAEGLALRIHQGDVPEPLKDATVFALDLGALVAGTRYRGDFEERVKQVLDRLAKHASAILFIDEIHTLVGVGAASGGAMDGGNLLKPALASGVLRCIGSTTFADVKQSFDRDRALARRFQKIDIVEPSTAETVEILKGLRSHYESHHGVPVHRRRARSRRHAVGQVPEGPASARQGDRCRGRGRGGPEAVAAGRADEGDRSRSHRARGGEDGSRAGPVGLARRHARAGGA